MYHLHLPAIPGPRGRAAVSLPFPGLDPLERYCKRSLVNTWASDGQTFQPIQACIKPALPNGNLSQGGEITIEGAALGGPRRSKSWIFSGPDSLDSANAVG